MMLTFKFSYSLSVSVVKVHCGTAGALLCNAHTRHWFPNLLTFDKAFKVFKEFNVLLVLQCSAELN